MAYTTAAGLAPYTGPFEREQAWHLLRRATFGATRERADQLAGLGLAGALDALLTADDAYGPPVNYDFADDPNVPIGATWVGQPYLDGADVNPYRSRSMQAWLLGLALNNGLSAHAKLHFFWHKHFAVPMQGDTRNYHSYHACLRRNALGNFRTLVREMTVEPQMLRFLNGDVNKATSPNENFARELLELFTLGKGPQVGPGDYTTYTEDDIRALSRALTGWRTRYAGQRDPAKQPESFFQESWHDTGAKQLSARFGGAAIDDAGDREYVEVVRLIFEHPAAAHYVCRKLYRYFVYYDVTPAVERDVIAPMAQLLRQSDFEVAPVVRALLCSEHFFAVDTRGATVKSPLEHVASLTTALGFDLEPAGADLAVHGWLLRRMSWVCNDQDMRLWIPPSVAGWKAYYQAPQYSRMWINASTLRARLGIVWQLTGNGVFHQGERYRIDALALIARFDNPTDPNALVAELAERVFPRPVPDAQLTALKEVLIPGLPDFEWTIEYDAHLADPADADVRESVERKLTNLLRAVFNAAESHLA